MSELIQFEIADRYEFADMMLMDGGKQFRRHGWMWQLESVEWTGNAWLVTGERTE